MLATPFLFHSKTFNMNDLQKAFWPIFVFVSYARAILTSLYILAFPVMYVNWAMSPNQIKVSLLSKIFVHSLLLCGWIYGIIMQYHSYKEIGWAALYKSHKKKS